MRGRDRHVAIDDSAFAFGRGVCVGTLFDCASVDSVTERAAVIALALIELAGHGSPDDAIAGFAYELAGQLGPTEGAA